MHTYDDIRSIVRHEMRNPEFREVIRDELQRYEYEKEHERWRRQMDWMVRAIWLLGLSFWAVAIWAIAQGS